jgi:hypothetical protein
MTISGIMHGILGFILFTASLKAQAAKANEVPRAVQGAELV